MLFNGVTYLISLFLLIGSMNAQLLMSEIRRTIESEEGDLPREFGTKEELIEKEFWRLFNKQSIS